MKSRERINSENAAYLLKNRSLILAESPLIFVGISVTIQEKKKGK